MASRKFALVRGGPKRLEVSSALSGKTEILFDGAPIGSFADLKAYKAGAEFCLPDGNRIYARLGGRVVPRAELLLNGFPVPGSDTDGLGRLRQASVTLFLAGGLTLLTLLLARGSFKPGIAGFLIAYGFVYGLVILGLGILVRRGSRVALGVAVALFALEFVALVALRVLTKGPSPSLFWLLAYLWFITGMFRGFGGVHVRHDQPTQLAAPQTGVVPPYGGPVVPHFMEPSLAGLSPQLENRHTVSSPNLPAPPPSA